MVQRREKIVRRREKVMRKREKVVRRREIVLWGHRNICVVTCRNVKYIRTIYTLRFMVEEYQLKIVCFLCTAKLINTNRLDI